VFGFLPPRSGGFGSDLGTFGLRHGLEAALPTDLTALAPNDRHVGGKVRQPPVYRTRFEREVSMLIRVALLLLWVTTALGQNSVEARSAGAVPYPRLIHAELPLYPPAAWSAHLCGTIEIDVTVEKGAVVEAQVKRGMIETQVPGEKGAVKDEQQAKLLSYLSFPSVANVKTWQFQPEGRTTFMVTYVYKIEGEQTPLPENPKIELDLPRVVKVTVRPFQPSCSDCVSQKGDGQQSHHDGASLSHEGGCPR